MDRQTPEGSFPACHFDADDVRRGLTYDACIPVIRQVMIEHSAGKTRHLVRSFLSLGTGRTFAQMPAALTAQRYFGAKLVSVFEDPAHPGRRRHRGVIVLFEAETGEAVAIADAEAVTLIRTAAASAVATDALARADARHLAILGTGGQAEAHARALRHVRPFETLTLWGRSAERARALAARLDDLDRAEIVVAASVAQAAQDADVICTVTSAHEPILFGAFVRPGTHVNLVGSSGPNARETDSGLVAKSRYFGDCREHVLQHGAELLRAIEEGIVDQSIFLGEIGEVLAGRCAGRLSSQDITVYKSLGHAVQDLAATTYLFEERLRLSGKAL